MSDAPRRTSPLPADRAAWQQKRDARQILLEKVRARRRLAMQRKQEVPQTGD